MATPLTARLWFSELDSIEIFMGIKNIVCTQCRLTTKSFTAEGSVSYLKLFKKTLKRRPKWSECVQKATVGG